MLPRIEDSALYDDDRLWRRVHDNIASINQKRLPTVRPSSAVFLDSTGEVSVFVASLKSQDEVLEDYPAFGLVYLEVKVPKGLDHIVAITPEDPDAAHRVIIPKPDCKIGRKAAARQMAEAAVWVVLPSSRRSQDG